MSNMEENVSKDIAPDIESMLSFLIPYFVILKSTKILTRKLTLQREQKYQNVIIHPVPQDLLESKFKKPCKLLVKMELSKRMNIFLKIIKINIPDANLSAFFENSQHFEFKKEKHGFLYNLFNEHKVTAYFKTDKNGLNSINFVMGSIDESIYHELLHMASTRIKGAFYFTGFMQSKSGEKPFTIGRGLNEGYTDVLTERYFSLYGAKTGGYALGSRISLLIELIVGKKNMEKWYFESDLYSLTRSLEKYLPYDEIISLLKKTDIIVNHAGVSGYGSVVRRMYNEVMRTFAEVAIRKISEEYDDSDIEQKISKMFLKSKLMVLLNNPVVSFGRVYKVYNDTEILDLLSKYMVYGNI